MRWQRGKNEICLYRSIMACLLCYAMSVAFARAAPSAVVAERYRTLLDTHCKKCHGAESQEGKFRLDTLAFNILDNQTAAGWQKVLNVLNSGDMPPADEMPLEKNAKADLLENLSQVMVTARRLLSDQHGRITMRRLSRREYKNTIRHLLGVELDVSELPSDTGTGKFDTVGANLFMSGDQFEQYQALGRHAVEQAFDRYRDRSRIWKKRIEAEAGMLERIRNSLAIRMEDHRRYKTWTHAIDQAATRSENREVVAQIWQEVEGKQPRERFYHAWRRIQGAPDPREYDFVDADHATHVGVGTYRAVAYQTWYMVQPENANGALLSIGDNGVNPWFTFDAGNHFPAGEYTMRIRVAATEKASPERKFLEFGLRTGGPFTHLSTHEVTGTMASPEVVEVPFTLRRNGDRTFFVREKGTFDTGQQSARRHNAGRKINGLGPEFALWVDWAEIERKPAAEQRKAPAIDLLGTALMGETSDSVDLLREGLERFANASFRGTTAPPSYLEKLITIYDLRQKAGDSHPEALKETLSVILASPRFLYLTEPNVNELQRRPLAARELAIRLAYFLWGTPPDEELLQLAVTDQLMQPGVLPKQINRLLDDPRSMDFVNPFVHQWLDVDRLDFFRFNGERYPRFDESTKRAARQEVYETMAHLVRSHGSLSNLLKADYVVVNSLLANYYGIDAVTGDEFRPVSVPADSPRGGLLGMAAILAMGSNGEQTSPVERGAWVLRKLLNDPPPPAPANVPQLTRFEDQLITTRARLLVHQEEPQCASCHRKIDPIGIGLENFDAVGQWRSEEHYEKPGSGRKTWTIDAASKLHTGRAFADYFELREIVASQADAFARGFSAALIEYALGRPCGFSDEPLIDTMLQQARERDLAVREFIHALVQSPTFQSK